MSPGSHACIVEHGQLYRFVNPSDHGAHEEHHAKGGGRWSESCLVSPDPGRVRRWQSELYQLEVTPRSTARGNARAGSVHVIRYPQVPVSVSAPTAGSLVVDTETICSLNLAIEYV